MKLAIVSDVSGYSWAGSEELWLLVALRALESGSSVTACLHNDLHAGKPLEEFHEKGGVLKVWDRCQIAKLEALKQRFIPGISLEKLGRPDVVLVSAGSLPSLTYVPGLMRFLESCRVPVIVICQFNSDILVMSASERSAIACLLRRANKIWFVSEQNRQVAGRQFAMNLPNAGVVYNPFRSRFDSPLPWPKNQDGPVLACVARMETVWKGQDLLVEILSHESWRQRSWRLRFYGVGPDLTRVKEWVQRLDLSNRVEFCGYVRSLEEIWSSASVMVLPSRGEGTPLAVLEAMMCGRPVITTDVGGNAEVLDEGGTGFLADAATPASFGRTLERAWQARDRWKEMGKAAHLRAKVLAVNDPVKTVLGSILSAGTNGASRSSSKDL